MRAPSDTGARVGRGRPDGELRGPACDMTRGGAKAYAPYGPLEGLAGPASAAEPPPTLPWGRRDRTIPGTPPEGTMRLIAKVPL